MKQIPEVAGGEQLLRTVRRLVSQPWSLLILTSLLGRGLIGAHPEQLSGDHCDTAGDGNGYLGSQCPRGQDYFV